MEERLERTSQPPQELSARAGELRAQAAKTDIKGFRDAALALADRYEEAAAARLASAWLAICFQPRCQAPAWLAETPISLAISATVASGFAFAAARNCLGRGGG